MGRLEVPNLGKECQIKNIIGTKNNVFLKYLIRAFAIIG